MKKEPQLKVVWLIAEVRKARVLEERVRVILYAEERSC